jgi:phosphoglycolate phosphatase-like HAD superfamily hydrolase
MEILNEVPKGAVKQVLFDFDGTVSVIREGWEKVMGPYMIEVLSEARGGENVSDEVYAYIEKSTGIQTILQMDWLVESVRKAGGEPLDAFEYKAEYNRRLLEVVNERVGRLERGEVTRDNLMVIGAREFLEHLHGRGIRMYVASGTDRDDVRREAAALGVADMFEGRIYGAIGRIEDYSKAQVIRDILAEHGMQGPELAVFGDGPVEIREAKAVGAIAVGVAVDEVAGHGWSERKRKRLTDAGADILVPDFSDMRPVRDLLGM